MRGGTLVGWWVGAQAQQAGSSGSPLASSRRAAAAPSITRMPQLQLPQLLPKTTSPRTQGR